MVCPKVDPIARSGGSARIGAMSLPQLKALKTAYESEVADLECKLGNTADDGCAARLAREDRLRYLLSRLIPRVEGAITFQEDPGGHS